MVIDAIDAVCRTQNRTVEWYVSTKQRLSVLTTARSEKAAYGSGFLHRQLCEMRLSGGGWLREWH